MKWILMIFLVIQVSSSVFADKLGQVGNRWGIVFIKRITQNPYKTGNPYNNDLFPLLYFEKDNFYVHGLDAGYQFYKIDETSDLKVIAKYRYFDLALPERSSRYDGINVGLEYHKELMPDWSLFFDLMTDMGMKPVGEIKSVWNLKTWRLYWEFYAGILIKSTTYNRRYYGLDEENPGADVDTSVGANVNFNFINHAYIFAGVESTHFGAKTIATSHVEKSSQEKYYVGAGLKEPMVDTVRLRSKYFQRYGFGFATPTNTIDIITKFKSEPDPYHNKLVSFFYGIPMSDDVMGLPMTVHFSPGFALHLENAGRQTYFGEFIGMIRLQYVIPLPIRLRAGFGEGLSYTSHISDIEEREMQERHLNASKMLNYLDGSIEISLHDIFRTQFFKGFWLGWYLHHRSGIYGNSALFNKVSGGSNFNTISFTFEY